MSTINDFNSQFKKSVAKNKNKKAIIYKGSYLTYQEVEEKSNQLAHYLINKGIAFEDVVGVLMERSDTLIVAMLGILKSGAAFLPLDPQFPYERLNYLVEDSNTKLILTKDENSNNSYNIPLLDINNLQLESYPTNRPNLYTKENDLAYIIYTSGTTGRPKGVQIEHKSVANLIYGINQIVNLDKYQNMLFLTTSSFDIFLVETIIPLCYGLTITIAHNAAFINARVLNQLIKENSIDIIQVTPSRLRQFLNSTTIMDSLSRIKVILLGGEVLTNDLVKSIKQISNCEIYNMYGPTETTVWSSVKKITNDEITIGKPISNTEIVILDEIKNQVEIGEVGEIYILGDGLSRGYISTNETRSKFIRLPNGKRAYKTGDLGKVIANGEIQVLGRLDDQVKIKGCTVNLNEVEAVIKEMGNIQDVTVVDTEDNKGINELYAFHTSTKVTNKEIMQYLTRKLPYYMIPKYYFKIDELPMTSNGKVSRKELRGVITHEK